MSEEGGRLYHFAARQDARREAPSGENVDPVYAAAAALANNTLVRLNYSPEGPNLSRILESSIGGMILKKIRPDHPVIDFKYSDIVMMSEQILREESKNE
jgi:hypothetical protein